MNNYWENEELLLNQRQNNQKLKRANLQAQPVVLAEKAYTPAQAVVLPLYNSDHDFDDRFLFSPNEGNDALEYTPSMNEELPSIAAVNFPSITDAANSTVTLNSRSATVNQRSYPTRIRSPAAKSHSPPPTNPYDGKDYETINEMLHGTYGYSSKGSSTSKKFNFQRAETDLTYLKEIKIGSLDDDPNNFMIGLWVDKIKVALMKLQDEIENENEETSSDDE